jgi:hypothetical protein
MMTLANFYIHTLVGRAGIYFDRKSAFLKDRVGCKKADIPARRVCGEKK